MQFNFQNLKAPLCPAAAAPCQSPASLCSRVNGEEQLITGRQPPACHFFQPRRTKQLLLAREQSWLAQHRPNLTTRLRLPFSLKLCSAFPGKLSPRPVCQCSCSPEYCAGSWTPSELGDVDANVPSMGPGPGLHCDSPGDHHLGSFLALRGGAETQSFVTFPPDPFSASWIHAGRFCLC